MPVPGRNKGIKVQLMEDKNCEFLFEYLRSILYDKEIQTLDITKLDEPYQTFLWEIGKNTEKSEGSFKRGFYHELQLWCGGI